MDVSRQKQLLLPTLLRAKGFSMTYSLLSVGKLPQPISVIGVTSSLAGGGWAAVGFVVPGASTGLGHTINIVQLTGGQWFGGANGRSQRRQQPHPRGEDTHFHAAAAHHTHNISYTHSPTYKTPHPTRADSLPFNTHTLLHREKESNNKAFTPMFSGRAEFIWPPLARGVNPAVDSNYGLCVRLLRAVGDNVSYNGERGNRSQTRHSPR